MAYGDMNIETEEEYYENPKDILKPSSEWTEVTVTDTNKALDTSNPTVPEYASAEETVCATYSSS